MRAVVAACALVFAYGCNHTAREGLETLTPAATSTTAVGQIGANQYLLPTGQLLTPAGRQIELPTMRPQMLALSPNGRLLATAGKSNALILINPVSGKIIQAVSLSTNRTEARAAAEKSDEPEDPAAKPDSPDTNDNEPTERRPSGSRTNAPAVQVSLTGLTFSPDGKRIYLATARGSIRAFPVNKNSVGIPVDMPLPRISGASRRQRNDIPTGLAVSPDGKRLYVAGSVANILYELDADTGKALRSWPTGVAPFDVALVGRKIYVSNLGGRRPTTNDLTASAGRNTTVRVDSRRHIPNEGSLTVIDLASDEVKSEILVGPHASALAVSPNGKYVVVANTADDTLSVIDSATDRVVEKIWTRQTPADPFGAQPTALAFDKSGKRLFVCNGTQNAVAVVAFEPEDNASKVLGLIPVGWFPGAIRFDPAHRKLWVANIKGVGGGLITDTNQPAKLASKQFFGTISIVPVPSTRQLASMTTVALANMLYPKLAEARLPARAGQPARPVPERVGEPSVFKHVIYVIKENRTYDQVLGDIETGNGDSNLCTFGERYTPNQHKIAREFVLLDNTYCSGVQSADGHQWTDSAIANEYVERQLTAGFPRSYPGGKAQDGIDALAWASSGFIWDNVLKHRKTFRNYGEWMITEAGWKDRNRRGSPSWRDFWNAHNGTNAATNAVRLRSRPGIETLRNYSNTNTVGWDLHVPDVMRAAEFIKELRHFETNGNFPDFVILFLPNDHTGGTRGRYPIPGAQVADNDLAFGQVVEAVSHSKFWPRTCIFAIEDDPQAGWDHVSGYRTTCYVVSPYTKRRQTISSHYNQTSLMRTMELILGLPPMNQLDATATPMTDCFMETADLTPFTSVPNRIPLDQLNPEPKQVTNLILRQDAIVSHSLPLDEMDKCPEDVFNRILWRAMKGPDVPYPTWAVKLVDDDD